MTTAYAAENEGKRRIALPALPAWVQDELAAQQERLPVWAAIIFSIGIALYFSLRFEPSAMLTTVFLAGAVLTRLLAGKRMIATAILLLAAGFAGAQTRTHLLNTVMLEKSVGPVTVQGRVSYAETLDEGRGVRVVLEDLIVEKLPPEKTPGKVRLSVRKGEMPPVGSTVETLARLNPPPAPAAPGAFDFQRYAYFNGIGAFGFTFRELRVIENSGGGGFDAKIASIRHTISQRMRERLDDPGIAAVTIALTTGERAAISETDNEAMRDSGLAHMLSISGMHIGMVAGTIFFFTRLVMAAFPGFAVHHPIKKYAALLAFSGALFYALLAGLSVPTLRSLVMTGIVLLAVVLDRSAISLRLLAVAAFAVLIISPDALWGASFQMSFAAVAGLIVFFEWIRPRWTDWRRDAGPFRKAALYIAGSCITTIIATATTAPFSLYHFQNLAVYGVLANAVTVPVMCFIVMPAGILVCLLIPLHLEAWPLRVMEWGVAFIVDVAHRVAELPGAVLSVPAFPVSVMILSVAGGAFVLFWKGWGKALAILPLTAALLIALQYRPPDILVSSQAKLLAVRDTEGRLHLSTRTAERFVGESWMRRNGEEGRKPPVWPKEGVDTDTGLSCDEGGCYLEQGGAKVAFAFHPSAHEEDCARANILIALDPVRVRPCRSATVIDRFDLWRNGAYAVWFNGRYETVASLRGDRPWTISHRR